jgi:MFS family permease
VEFLTLRRSHPLISARIAALLHPVGAAILGAVGPAGAAAFAICYGAGNGLLTIARGTVPLAVFGPDGYGERTGLLGAPARAAQALAPLLFGLLLDRMGASVIIVSAALCLAAFAAAAAPLAPRIDGRAIGAPSGVHGAVASPRPSSRCMITVSSQRLCLKPTDCSVPISRKPKAACNAIEALLLESPTTAII